MSMIVMGMVVMAVSCVAVPRIDRAVQGNGARRGRGDRGMGVVMAIVVVRMRRVVVSVAGGCVRLCPWAWLCEWACAADRLCAGRPVNRPMSSGPAFFHSSQAPKAVISA